MALLAGIKVLHHWMLGGSSKDTLWRPEATLLSPRCAFSVVVKSDALGCGESQPCCHGALAHSAESSSEVKSRGSLIIPAHIAEWNRPFLDLCRLKHRLAQRWGGKAIGAFVRADPD
jgi:hypothetical protein